MSSDYVIYAQSHLHGWLDVPDQSGSLLLTDAPILCSLKRDGLLLIAMPPGAPEATDELAAMSLPDNHAFSDFVLREKSRACKLEFRKCLNVDNLPHEDWLEQRSAEFNWWTSGLNADKNGPGSLDARLRLRPDVTAVIVDALDGLHDALSTYHELGGLLHNPDVCPY